MQSEAEKLLALAERCEPANADMQGRLLEESWEACAEHSLTFRRFAMSYLPGFDNQAAKFAMCLEARAYESAAIMLAPEAWEWGCGHKDATGLSWAWVGKPVANRADWEPMVPVNAATPALSLTAAALRARAKDSTHA